MDYQTYDIRFQETTDIMSNLPFQETQTYVEPSMPGQRPARCNLLPMYQQLNHMYFDGILPSIPVVFNSRLSSVYGRCHAIRKKKIWHPIKIDIQYPIASQRMLRKVLVHEMCHAWSIIQHQERGHGKVFWKKMAQCGYPDGHQFANALASEKDKYDSDMTNYSFEIGHLVSFENSKKEKLQGTILSINKRTISIQTNQGKYRVSPSLLSIEEDTP